MSPGGIALSSGLIVYRESPNGREYLILRAFKNWDFPKGMVESGEDPFETATRETREETSLEKLDFPRDRKFIETPPYAARGGKKIARFYLGRAAAEAKVKLGVNPELGHPEHHEYRWSSFDEAHALLSPRLKTALEWAEAQIMVLNQ